MYSLGEAPQKRPYGHFRGGLLQGKQLAAVFYPLGFYAPDSYGANVTRWKDDFTSQTNGRKSNYFLINFVFLLLQAKGQFSSIRLFRLYATAVHPKAGNCKFSASKGVNCMQSLQRLLRRWPNIKMLCSFGICRKMQQKARAEEGGWAKGRGGRGKGAWGVVKIRYHRSPSSREKVKGWGYGVYRLGWPAVDVFVRN